MKENKRILLIFTGLFLCVFIPPIAEVSFTQEETALVIRDVMVQTSVAYLWLSPLIHVTTLMLLVALCLYGRRIGRVADTYFGVLFLFVAFGNHIAMTENYGLVVITSNLVMVLIVGLCWMWEAFRPRNTYVFQRFPAWRYWFLPFVILAFWSPINTDLSPNFNPLLLLTSSFGVMFCPTTPVVIAILTLIYPRVNMYLLRITSFVGLLIGLFNIMSFFTMPGYTLWNLTLHTPLISISAFGLLIPTLVKKKECT